MQNPDDPAALAEAMEIFRTVGYVFGTDHETTRWRDRIRRAGRAQGLPICTGLTPEGWWWAAVIHLTEDEQELLLTEDSEHRIGRRRQEAEARRAHPTAAVPAPAPAPAPGPTPSRRHLRLVR